MNKGITLAAACRTIRAFAQAGIMVHLYLMYGFPTQSAQEIVDGLEVVRRLFLAGWIQSAYWHRFALTIHSPMAMRPERFGIQPATPTNGPIFAHNELRYASRGAPDYRAFGPGLKKAVYNYMLGLGLEDDVTAWFDFPVPEPRAIRLPPQLPAS
jgi:hypothetical protein